MALSDKEISALYFEALGSQHLREQDRKMVTRFAHAIEADVRKQDDELIRKMYAALDASEAFLLSAGFESSDAFQEVSAALTAGRAWLEGKK